MVRGHQQIFDVVLVDRLDALDPAAAAVLHVEVVHRHALDVAELGARDHDVVVRDEILDVDVAHVDLDAAAAVVAVLLRDLVQLVANDAEQQLFVAEDRPQTIDRLQ